MAKLVEKEIKEIARLIAGIERHSEENDPTLDKQLEMVTKVFEDFHNKYQKLSLKIEREIDSLYVKFFIHESSVKSVFDNAASKIKGLTGVGLHSFEEATIKDAEKFASLVGSIHNQVYLSYSLDFGVETIVLDYNEKEKKVELNFEIKSLVNPITPQYQLVQQYALQEVNHDIDILQKCYEVGFMDIEDAALFEWEDEFYPKMLE